MTEKKKIQQLSVNIRIRVVLFQTSCKIPCLPEGLIICLVSVFKPDELRQALMPVLEKLYRQDPESLPFRQPVDPVALQIPVSC